MHACQRCKWCESSSRNSFRRARPPPCSSSRCTGAGSSGGVTGRRSSLPWRTSALRRCKLGSNSQFVPVTLCSACRCCRRRACAAMPLHSPGWHCLCAESLLRVGINGEIRASSHRCNRRVHTSALSRASTLAPSCGVCCWLACRHSCSKAHSLLLPCLLLLLWHLCMRTLPATGQQALLQQTLASSLSLSLSLSCQQSGSRHNLSAWGVYMTLLPPAAASAASSRPH